MILLLAMSLALPAPAEVAVGSAGDARRNRPMKSCDFSTGEEAQKALARGGGRLGGTQRYDLDGWAIFRDPAQENPLGGVFCVHGNRFISAPKIPDSFEERGDDLILASHTEASQLQGKHDLTGVVRREVLYVMKTSLREAPPDRVGSFTVFPWAHLVQLADGRPRHVSVALAKGSLERDLREMLDLAPEGHLFRQASARKRILAYAKAEWARDKRLPPPGWTNRSTVTLWFEPYDITRDKWETMDIVTYGCRHTAEPGTYGNPHQALKLADLTGSQIR